MYLENYCLICLKKQLNRSNIKHFFVLFRLKSGSDVSIISILLLMTYCKTAWLIDDDELCNFLTDRILQSNNFCSETRSFTNAQDALTELEASSRKGMFPDFIFLDINMPVLDGWGFLNAYQNFPKEVKENCTLYILSSSVDEEDINKSKLHEDVQGFLSKPLKKMDLEIVKIQERSSD